MDELSQVDLAFCIDLTSSMSPFIAAAQQHVVRILEGLRVTARADLRVALVGYRDHEHAQDSSPVEVYDFTDDAQSTRDALYALRVGSPRGNTDAAEAVVAGLLACTAPLAWRPQSYRVLVLVGDGPPHASRRDGAAVARPLPRVRPRGRVARTDRRRARPPMDHRARDGDGPLVDPDA